MKTIFKGNKFSVIWSIFHNTTKMPLDFTGMNVEVSVFSDSHASILSSYNIADNVITTEIGANSLPCGVYDILCRYSTLSEQAYCFYRNAFQISNNKKLEEVESVELTTYATHITSDAILSQFNNIFINYLGNSKDTRNSIHSSMRRKGLIISYINENGETITEKAVSDAQKDNCHWGLDTNWARIDNLSLSGDIAVSANGTWIIDGQDTGIVAVGPKGDTGITPLLKTIDNKLHFSYDNVIWEPCSDSIAAYFRFNATSSDGQGMSVGKFQISRDNKNWEDLSPEITNALRIAGYVATSSALPSGKPVGTIFGVGPTFAAEDTAHTNPIYRLYVYDGSKWVDNGTFTSIAAGVVQETGNSETLVMSQKATTEKLSELGQYVSDNPEYARAYTDAEGRFLWGIKQDGSIEWSKGVPTPIKKYVESLDLENDEEIERINQLVIGLTDTFHYETNPEWAHAIVDSEYRIVMGIKSDGSFYVPNRDMYHVETSPEWACAIVDAEERILMGIKFDGSYCIPNREMYHVESNPEWLQVTTDLEGKVIEGIKNDGKKYYAKQELLEKYVDIEGRTEMVVDSDGKILSYRDENGVKHENNLSVKELTLNDKVNFKGNSLYYLEDALRKSGFTGGTGDWSDKTSLEIPTPRCAIVNISGINAMPTSKTQDLEAYFEMWDMQGNYFKKRVILNAQGSSSMSMPKKNFAIDLCNDEWVGDDTFRLRIGDWVAQDSFHFKAYYTDFFRGSCVIGYQIADLIHKSRGIFDDRVWKRALIGFDAITSSSEGEQIDDLSLQIDNGARCFPDGFPCIAYLNGEFYGVFSWQLKKHRDNYHQNKKNVKHIHLDGTLGYDEIWGANGDASKISWTSFEVRNPKSLVNIDGTEYNGDEPKELMDSTSSAYNETDKDCVNTNKVKDCIKALSTYIPELMSMKDSGSNIEEIKGKIEKYFDIPSMIDYIILCSITRNGDGFKKNWQWTTYDGIKWYVNPYDMDGIFGAYHLGNYIGNASGSILGTSLDIPSGWVYQYYKEDLKERWESLKEIVNKEVVIELYNKWMQRIGEDFFEMEYDKWNESPCNRDSNVNSEYWKSEGIYVSSTWSANTSYSQNAIVRIDMDVFKSLVGDNRGNDPRDNPNAWENLTYDKSKAYAADDIAYYGLQTYPYKFSCVKACTSESPMDNRYSLYPMELGHRDNIWRLAKTIAEVFALLNEKFNDIV